MGLLSIDEGETDWSKRKLVEMILKTFRKLNSSDCIKGKVEQLMGIFTCEKSQMSRLISTSMDLVKPSQNTPRRLE